MADLPEESPQSPVSAPTNALRPPRWGQEADSCFEEKAGVGEDWERGQCQGEHRGTLGLGRSEG